MRIDLSSGLPVVVSDDQGRPLSTRPEMDGLEEKRQAVKFRLALKRLAQWPSWHRAYANPFIHGSFLTWYRDDPTYERQAEHAYDVEAAAYEPPQYEAFGLSVIKAE